MRGALDRTKVVLRHLPPTISRATLLDQIDATFEGRYNWVSVHPGKSRFGIVFLLVLELIFSLKHQSYSTAYIDFKNPEDVIEFAEFFDGHVFVNEKGSQFKVIVEYAPSQRVPKHLSKKDVREGTIYKDSEYLEFLENLAKPIENLPSAEIQLERKEAERSGVAKDNPVVTPLMDFVRQKRASKGSRKSLSNGKVSRRGGALSTGSPSSGSLRRGSGKKKVSTTMYVVRDSAKSATVKDKSTYVLVPKQGDRLLSDRTTDGNQAFEDESASSSGVSGPNDVGKKKVLLLKGRRREIITVSDSDSMSQQHSVTSSSKMIFGSTAPKQNQRQEGSGRIIRRILSNKDLRQSQLSRPYSEQQIQTYNQEKEKRPPRPSHVQLITKGTNGISEDKTGINDLQVFSERQETGIRNKDRADRGVWTYSSNGGDDSLSSASSQVDSVKGSHAELKHDMRNAKRGEVKTLGSLRSSQSSENGFSKHFGRRGPTHGMKDGDGFSVSSEGKHPRRSNASVYGSHEKQVWVQKASSGT
ncbi:regulator of nonsense transcripts UPF3-like isoform X1 [Senna tora]|uniref:Regulator of nonsense transcripts UPF3-like isoform X1 n=1 Tax=Senna tora TaxID=362788 RepID=A0A834XCW9_9FABA|nr:regulator of nonsense transcripts UPF3-like isoform X1 [Senna tora]